MSISVKEAFVDTIRSVVAIDDQFATYDDLIEFNLKADKNSTTSIEKKFAEATRGREMLFQLRKLGKTCEVENLRVSDYAEKSASAQRLKQFDLIILDYHLDSGDDSRKSRDIIRSLSQCDEPNMVVIYTAHRKRTQIVMEVAQSIRSPVETIEDEIDDETVIDDFNEKVDLKLTEKYIGNDPTWMQTFGINSKDPSEKTTHVMQLRTLFENHLSKQTGITPTNTNPNSAPIERCSLSESNYWLSTPNLFVAVINKPASAEILEEKTTTAGEIETVLTGLEAALKAWNPSPLGCTLAYHHRKSANWKTFNHLAKPVNPSLQNGLSHYITVDERGKHRPVAEKHRISSEIASNLLAIRNEEAVRRMAEDLADLPHVETVNLRPTTIHSTVSGASNTRQDHQELIAINSFLCCQKPIHHHLRLGAVFTITPNTDSRYSNLWVCVTPNCDLVPRDRSGAKNWTKRLGNLLPFMALKLEHLTSTKAVSDAIQSSTQGRYLFLEDFSPHHKDVQVVCASLSTTNDPNPNIEQMFAQNSGRVSTDSMRGRVLTIQPTDHDHITSECHDFEIICQLRAPYAERLGHIVGHHLARIGVNFVTQAKKQTSA